MVLYVWYQKGAQNCRYISCQANGQGRAPIGSQEAQCEGRHLADWLILAPQRRVQRVSRIVFAGEFRIRHLVYRPQRNDTKYYEQ